MFPQLAADTVADQLQQLHKYDQNHDGQNQQRKIVPLLRVGQG